MNWRETAECRGARWIDAKLCPGDKQGHAEGQIVTTDQYPQHKDDTANSPRIITKDLQNWSPSWTKEYNI